MASSLADSNQILCFMYEVNSNGDRAMSMFDVSIVEPYGDSARYITVHSLGYYFAMCGSLW